MREHRSQQGEDHHMAKLKNADVKRLRIEYTTLGRPYGWLKRKWQELQYNCSYSAFTYAINGRQGNKTVWKI